MNIENKMPKRSWKEKGISAEQRVETIVQDIGIGIYPKGENKVSYLREYFTEVWPKLNDTDQKKYDQKLKEILK